MIVITHARRKSNLARMIDTAGGVSVGVALANARANIEAKRAEAMGVVEGEIAALEALPAPSAPDELQPRLDQAYRAASGVIDVAGPFELLDLCTAASGLCDLIDGAPRDHPFDWRIIKVHAQSLRLLKSLPADAVQARMRVLESLREIIERKLAQTG